jgi:hypothetical protein
LLLLLLQCMSKASLAVCCLPILMSLVPCNISLNWCEKLLFLYQSSDQLAKVVKEQCVQMIRYLNWGLETMHPLCGFVSTICHKFHYPFLLQQIGTNIYYLYHNCIYSLRLTNIKQFFITLYIDVLMVCYIYYISYLLRDKAVHVFSYWYFMKLKTKAETRRTVSTPNMCNLFAINVFWTITV